MKYFRTTLYLAIFTACYAPILFYYALSWPPALDEGIILERMKRAPSAFDTRNDYYYAVEHPAIYRWIGRGVLRLFRVEIGDVPKVDLTKSLEWNVENGRTAPRRPVLVLRAVNVVLLVGALVALFFLARIAFGGYAWGFVLAAPIALPPALGRYIGGYILTDAYLTFFLAATLLAWVVFHHRPKPASIIYVIAIGVLLGFTISAKLNGALILLAYVAYLAVVARGPDRVWLPFVAVLAASTTFVALNPVMQKGGLLWPALVARDMIAARSEVYQAHNQFFGYKGTWGILLFMFPHWYLLPLLIAPILKARTETWFPPVFLWSTFLVLGTALTIEQPFNRYLMPINLGLTALVMMSAIAVARRLYARQIQLADLLKP